MPISIESGELFAAGGTQSQSVMKRREKRMKVLSKRAKTESAPSALKARKLTFTESHELKELPDALEALESQKSALLERMADADYYKRPQAEQAVDRAKLEETELQLTQKMARWEELEELNG